MAEEIAKRNWLRIFSPCFLASIFSLVSIVISLTEFEKSGGWSMLGVVVYLPILIVLLTIDFLLKHFSKSNTLFLWLIEIGIIAFIVLAFLKGTG